jgi:peroxiredoxin
MMSTRRTLLAALAALPIATWLTGQQVGAAPPAVGDEAKDFELPTLEAKKIKLSTLTDAGPVILVVLRGYPGYQCPLCTRQVGEFLGKAEEIKTAKAKVVFVYPGPSDALANHAKTFFAKQSIPDHVTLLIDPDYTFTKAYDLRWDAKNETAYPSTFVLNGQRKILYAKVSKTHGGRAPIAEVLKALPKP